MGEEVRMSEYEANGDNTNGNDEQRVADWEFGLPSVDDLTPLSQPLIPLELASAFSILPEPHRTVIDVNRESQNTLLNIRNGGAFLSNNFKSYNNGDHTTAEAAEETEAEEINNNSDQEKLRRIDSEEADSALRTENSSGEDPAAAAAAARTLKRPRLVWTPQLHKRFVDVVAYLGIKNAVPKTIMQLMNVEGLTRENVASHLQKYRLYLKRMQGLSNEGPSASDQLFASTPVPQSLHENSSGHSNGGSGGGGVGSGGNGHLGIPMPVPYHPGVGPMMPMQMYGHMGMQMGNNNNHHHHNHPYNNMLQQHREWSGNNYHM